MKKSMMWLMVVMLVMTLVCPFLAIAEGAVDGTVVATAQDTDTVASSDTSAAAPYTWSYLATIAGATAATLLIAQFLKFPLDRIWRIPTRILVYVIALMLLLIATALTTGLNVENFLLAFVNAFVVAFAAYGAYELTFAKLK